MRLELDREKCRVKYSVILELHEVFGVFVNASDDTSIGELDSSKEAVFRLSLWFE